jgi:hypothetical protein
VKVAASTVWEILQEARIDPAPERSASTWADVGCQAILKRYAGQRPSFNHR